MNERLINAIICRIQSALVKQYGDTQEVTNKVRALTAELKAAKVSQYQAIEKKYSK